MGESLRLQVRSAIPAILPASEAAAAWLDARKAGADAVFLVNLALDELVTNCIKYAYDDAQEHTIGVELSIANGEVVMIVIDDGRAFDPLSAPRPDLSLPIEERPIGGLGIHLLRELSDAIRYERRDGTNRLTLIKRIA